ILLAATNRPEVLDPALLRAGRFDRQVLVDRPDKAGRVQVLQVHVRKVRLSPEVDLETVAALTPGFAGADLANRVNQAARLVTRQELDNKMAGLLGGRAAEHIVYGEWSTGAADDLAKVTDIARSIVTRYGMSEELGPIACEKSPHSFLGGGEQPQAPFQERS